MPNHPLSGVYAAAVTPINKDMTIALEDIPMFLAFLAERGCHGALILGTTGEGPSFSVNERLEIFKSALKVRQVHPSFRLLAGTGTPSLEETILLTRLAFDLGFDAAVVLPPYYYFRATEEGLAIWFREVIKRAVPQDGVMLGYHFPEQTHVPIPLSVLSSLRDVFPRQFAGIKDSSGNAEYAFQIGKTLDQNTLVLVGNDKLLLESLRAGGSGCITGMANLHSPALRKIWDCYQKGEDASSEQVFVNAKRTGIDPYRPFPATIKTLLHAVHNLPDWSVRPPLTHLSTLTTERMLQEVMV